MAANLGLITDATERHTHKLTVGGPGDRLAERGLTDPGWAHQTENRGLDLIDPLLNREILQNAFLHLVKPIVLFFENLLSIFKVIVNLALLFPGQIH